MEVVLLDLKAQLEPIRDEVKKAIDEVIESTRYIMGPKVVELEKTLAKYCSAAFGIGVSSGTDALLVSLMALDIQPDDLVITTPYSFFATAGVIARLRAVPVFIDIEPDTYNMDPQALKNWFYDNPKKAKKVKSMIPVHLYGQCADMDPILEMASQFDIPVIEDAAQAIGARYPSSTDVRKAGSMGAMGCFSFFPSKNLGAMGDGGMVVTNDEGLAYKLIKLRNHGASPKYYHSLIGGNFRLDPIQAAILLVKFTYLETWHKGRQENAAYYDAHLNVEGIQKPVIAYEREYHIYNQYVISVPDRRDDLGAFLKKKQVGHEIYYPVPFHQQACFQYLGYQTGDFPNSEHAASHTLALPIYPELTREMQDYVIEAIMEFYQ
ncbi:DegT/DnrJ/EryC1/StrS family aminotransferase [bacterium]|nr:DegT/DnrJ/EryC1/StrS family aminotransferase [bacterium]RQV99136.1 MAG: DegT/DnrJ/EryC1/StrS family aminotransferase [bacterium]